MTRGAAGLASASACALALAAMPGRGPAGSSEPLAPSVARAACDAPAILDGHRAGVTGVAFAPDGEWVVSCSLDGTVKLWSTEAGVHAGAQSRRAEHEWRHGAEVYAVAIAHDGELVAWSGEDGRVAIAERGAEGLLHDLKLPQWSVALAFAPDGTLLVAGIDRQLRWIDAVTGEVRRSTATGFELLALAVSDDGTRIATGPPIRVFDFDSGRLLHPVAGHGQGGLAFSPDGTLLAAAEWVAGVSLFAGPAFQRAGTLRLDVQQTVLGREGFAPITVNMPAAAVAFAPDGATLAVAGTHREIPLFPVVDGKVAETPRRSLRGHAMTVTSVAFSPEGKRLVSGSLDGTVRIWDVE